MAPITCSIAPITGPWQPAHSTRAANVSRLRLCLTAPDGKRWSYTNGQIFVNGVRCYTECESRGVRLTLHPPQPRPVKAITSTYTHHGDSYRVVKGKTYRNDERYVTKHECRGKRVRLNPPKKAAEEKEMNGAGWPSKNDIECSSEVLEPRPKRRLSTTRSRNVAVQRRHVYEAFGAY